MIYLYPMDWTGCGNYRVRWPALEMKKQDPDFDMTLVFPGDDAGVKAHMDSRTGQVNGVTAPSDCEVVVLQRPTNELLVDSIPFLQKEGVRVVIDIDDDLAAISPRHPGWAFMHKQADTGQSWDAVVRACQYADMVVASTPALLERYARHGRGVVMRNCLPDSFFDIELPEKKDDPHVGWGGAILSHPDDLTVLGPSLAQLGVKVKVVGPVPLALGKRIEDVKRAYRLLGTDRVEFTGAIDFDQWIPAISEIFVGMAPLEVTRFNVAKSWLKPLEYSVARVPFVASDLPEYRELGAGILASRPKDWRLSLKKLLNNESAREEQVLQNLDIANRWRVSLHAAQWREAWLGS